MITQLTSKEQSAFQPGSAKTVYVLYLLGLVIGITGIVGVVDYPLRQRHEIA